MPGLAAVGILSYNGYTFDGSSRVKCKRENVRDEANRTTKYVEIEITVAATVVADAGTNASLDTIKAALTCEGGALQYTNSGFGSELLVNVGAVKDVQWGPKPQVLMWEPVGSHSAAEVVWTVTTCIPPCGTSGRWSGMIALNYDATYDIDENGDTTRTISGYLEIAQTRINNALPCASRALPDSADKYRQYLIRKPPLGFTRKHNFRVSKDKSRLDFTITDRQIPSPNPYPTNTTAITGKHSVQITRGAMVKWRNVITVNITPNRGINGANAWQFFLKLVAQRKALVEQQGQKVLFNELSLEEDIFGRPCAFRLSYFILTANLQDIVKNSGLWSPLGTSWDDWNRSLQNSTFNLRGNAALIEAPENDSIIDSCGAPAPSPNTPANIDYPQSVPSSPALKSSTPTPQKSWFGYSGGMGVYSSDGTMVHSPSQDSGVSGSSGNQNPSVPGAEADVPYFSNDGIDARAAQDFQSPPVTGNGQKAKIPGLKGAKPDIIQRRGAPRRLVHLVGGAYRAGFHVPRPIPPLVSGEHAIELRGWFVERPVGNFHGVYLYHAWWDIWYAITKTDQGDHKPPQAPTDQ